MFGVGRSSARQGDFRFWGFGVGASGGRIVIPFKFQGFYRV